MPFDRWINRSVMMEEEEGGGGNGLKPRAINLDSSAIDIYIVACTGGRVRLPIDHLDAKRGGVAERRRGDAAAMRGRQRERR